MWRNIWWPFEIYQVNGQYLGKDWGYLLEFGRKEQIVGESVEIKVLRGGCHIESDKDKRSLQVCQAVSLLYQRESGSRNIEYY